MTVKEKYVCIYDICRGLIVFDGSPVRRALQ